MKFAFIHAEKASFPIAAMCRLLGVTRQGYYAYARRPVSARVRDEAELCATIRDVFKESGEAYGSPRVLKELQNRGFVTGKRRVERAMRGMGPCPPSIPRPPARPGMTFSGRCWGKTPPSSAMCRKRSGTP